MKEKMSVLKAIRANCLQCSGFSKGEVRKCGITGCPLHSYRFGTNPKRKNVGGRITPLMVRNRLMSGQNEQRMAA